MTNTERRLLLELARYVLATENRLVAESPGRPRRVAQALSELIARAEAEEETGVVIALTPLEKS